MTQLPDSAMRSVLVGTRLIPVLVLEDAAHAVPVVEALGRGGLACVEVTLRTPTALRAIEALAELDSFVVGAGTVLNLNQTNDAIAAGAKFIVSPGLDPAIVSRCQERSIPVLPGIATASEIQAAMRMGLDVVKFFPAESLGGAGTVKALAAPFGTVAFVPTGGVSPENLAGYLSQPHVLAVGGSWMVAPGLVQARDWDAITARTREAVALAARYEPQT